MSYSIDKFLRPLTVTDRNVQIYGNDGKVQYTIMPYSVVSLLVNSNVIRVNLKSGKVISLPFATNDIAKAAMAKLRLHIDTLKTRTPLFIDKEIENYVAVNAPSGGGGTISTTTNTIYNFSHGEITPGDGETYYIGDISTLPPNNISSEATRVLTFVGGHVTQVSILTSIGGATGSGETQSFSIRNFTTGSQSLITDSFVSVGSSQINNYFLNEPLQVNSGDSLEILWETPIFTVTPTLVRNHFSVYLGVTGPDGSYFPGPAGSSGVSGTSGTSGYDGDRYYADFIDTKTIPVTFPLQMTFSVGSGLAYSVNQAIRISAGFSNFINATVITYNPITGLLTTSATSKIGSGTFTNWNVNLFGAAGGGTSGSSGSSGSSGTSGTSGSSGTSFTDGTFSQAINFTNQFSLGGILTPPQLTANTNNWNPIGMTSANILRISSNSSLNLTGIVAPSPLTDQVFYVFNVGSQQISFLDNSGLSSAGNKFLFGNNRTLQANEGLILWYDILSSGWRSPVVGI